MIVDHIYHRQIFRSVTRCYIGKCIVLRAILKQLKRRIYPDYFKDGLKINLDHMLVLLHNNNNR